MNNRIYLFAAFLTVAAACTAELENPDPVITDGVAIVASTESPSGSARTSIEGNDAEGYQVIWSEGDSFKLQPVASMMAVSGVTYTINSAPGSSTAQFVPESLVDWASFSSIEAGYCIDPVNPVWPAAQTYGGPGVISNSPMRAKCSLSGVAPESIEFKNLGGLVRLTLKGNIEVTSITLATNENIAGPLNTDGSVSGVSRDDPRYTTGGAAIVSKGSDGGNTITLSMPSPVQLTDEGVDFYFAVPQYSAGYTGVSFTVTDIKGHTYTRSLKSDVTLPVSRSKITSTTLTIRIGLFSIAAGTRAEIASGNVQYCASPSSWRFAPNAFDRLTTQNSNASGSYTGWIDLFAWGTGNYYWSNAYNFWNGKYHAAGFVSDAYFDDGTFDTYYEWGNGFSGNWHTPSISEWDYVLAGRSNASKLVTVCQITPDDSTDPVPGLLLLPDGWIAWGYDLPKPYSEVYDHSMLETWWEMYEGNSYTQAQWEDLQKKGAVFLPCAGYIEYTSTKWIQPYVGNYWTCDAAEGDNAKNFWFPNYPSQWWLSTSSNDPRQFALAVRLFANYE